MTKPERRYFAVLARTDPKKLKALGKRGGESVGERKVWTRKQARKWAREGARRRWQGHVKKWK